jgi:hypothetical protein
MRNLNGPMRNLKAPTKSKGLKPCTPKNPKNKGEKPENLEPEKTAPKALKPKGCNFP